MKTKLTTLVKSMIILLIYQSLFSTRLQAQTTAIPDANFEQALINLGIDSDGTINGQVLTADVETVTTLDINYYDTNIGYIQDLTGIEDFVNLEVLNVNGHALTALNVSHNLQLRELYCSSGDTYFSMLFTSLDLSHNPNMEILFGDGLVFLESLNLKNGNNSILSQVSLPCIAHGGMPCDLSELRCVKVDNETAATNGDAPYSSWYFQSSTFAYSEDCTTGVTDHKIEDIDIYPNPIKSSLFIKNRKQLKINKITLYDILGNVIFTENKFVHQIKLSELKSGTYFIRIETDKGVINKRILKK